MKSCQTLAGSSERDGSGLMSSRCIRNQKTEARGQRMHNEPEIACKMQRGMKVALSWCELAQYQQICRGCKYNEGRKRSKHQKGKKR